MKSQREKIELLVEKASNREEVYRRFDPKRERYSGSQMKSFINAYNKMIRAEKKLEKALVNFEQ